MSDVVGDGEGGSWNQTSQPVKIVILVIFAIMLGVGLIIWCVFLLPVHIAAIFTTSTPAATATATTAPPVTSSPNVRLSAEAPASPPTFSHSISTEGDRNQLECSVCLMEFKEGEEGRFLPRCLHRFHTECIDMWFSSHSTCPLCRTVVEVETV